MNKYEKLRMRLGGLPPSQRRQSLRAFAILGAVAILLLIALNIWVQL